MATQAEPITMRNGRVAVADIVVTNEAQNERALAMVERLMSNRDRTADEEALLNVLMDLIHSFESRMYARPESTPAELIQFLLEQNGQAPKDLWEVLGGKSHASEILSGKRRVGVALAVRLGKYFNISPGAFIRLR